jgi:hypothetical protein
MDPNTNSFNPGAGTPPPELVGRNPNTHPWPPRLKLPDHWIEPVARLIQELNLPIADARAAIARVRQFVDRILLDAKMPRRMRLLCELGSDRLMLRFPFSSRIRSAARD